MKTWYVGASSWAGVSCEKFGFLSSRSMSQCGLKSSNNLLNFWTFCNQTWYCGASSRAGVLCADFGLLCSRSRLQWGFKSGVTICPGDICWTTSIFLNETWCVGVASWRTLSCETFGFVSQRSRSQCRLKFSKQKCLIVPYLLNLCTFYNQTWYSGAL